MYGQEHKNNFILYSVSLTVELCGSNKTDHFSHVVFKGLNDDLLSEPYFHFTFEMTQISFLFANDNSSESHIVAFTRIEGFQFEDIN